MRVCVGAGDSDQDVVPHFKLLIDKRYSVRDNESKHLLALFGMA